MGRRMITRPQPERPAERFRRATRASRQATELDELGDVLAESAVEVGFQPVVDIAGRRVVGYEALVRGPRGCSVEQPDRLFAAARAAGRLDELDWLCQRLALEGALRAGLRAPQVLFVNVEPDTSEFMPLQLRSLYARATSQMTVAVEVTERALTERPAALLGHVADIRALGCAIALDDVGAEAGSIAMMALLAPEVIKLDVGLFASTHTRDVAELVDAVAAQAEQSRATVLVERIETEAEAALAEALGGELAQGWLYGRREPLGGAAAGSGPTVVAQSSRLDPRDTTPWSIIARRPARPARRAGPGLLLALGRRLEERASRAGRAAVLLASVAREGALPDPVVNRYMALAERLGYCALVGPDMPSEPAPGVCGARVHPHDPLWREWAIAVVSPHFAAAMSAHDLGRDQPAEQRFEFALTYDRELAVAAASALMARVTR